MTRYFLKTVVVLLLGLSPGPGYAEDNVRVREVYRFDKDHTNIVWYVSHMGFSKSMGQFMDYDGQIILDHDNPAQSSVTITLQTASIMTGLADFDAHLKSADFFDVEKYPVATFTSTKIILLTDRRAKVEGNFTLLGITRPVTLNVRFNKRALDIKTNKMRTGFSIKTTVKRSRWGMKKYLPFVGDNVIIRIEAEALINQ